MLPFFENKQEQIYVNNIQQMNFPAHLHHHIELLHVTKGSLEVQIGTQWGTVPQGGLVAIFPGKVHAYRTPLVCDLMLLIVPLSFAGPLKSIYRDNQPTCPIISANLIPKALTDNFAELLQLTNQPIMQGLAHLILARLLSLVSLQPRMAYDEDNLLCSAISAISRCYRENLSLGAIATQLGVSICHLSRILRSGTGIGFREYINALRIADAQNLLTTTDLLVLEIAMECGFQNLRTFNRAFFANVQCTPKEYRKHMLQGKGFLSSFS